MSIKYNYLRCRLPVLIEPKTICRAKVVAKDEEQKKTTISEGENHLFPECDMKLGGEQNE